MEIPRQLITIWAVFVVLWNPVARAVEAPPSPTPTPQPGTLAALGRTTTLERPRGAEETSPIFITDDNLDHFSDGAVLTVLTSTIADPPVHEANQEVDSKTRSKWRSKVVAQGKVIANLEARRDDVRVEINRLGRGKLDGRTLDRIAKAETKLKMAEKEIKLERANLSRIVRAARQDGAQPGWFR